MRILSDKIYVEVEKELEVKKTKSGIILPDDENKRPKSLTGTIRLIGQGKWENGYRIPLDVNIGDKVVFKTPWAEEYNFEEDGKKFCLITQEDIFYIL
jgi:chaperonin GroES